jgi:hypothetical protein
VFGVSPISGTVISQNIVKDEAVGIVTNTPTQVNAHLNDLLGHSIGVDNLGTGTVDATENWWGVPVAPARPAVRVLPEPTSPLPRG